MNNLLSQAQKNIFYQNGILVYKNFFKLKKEIEPIQYGIYHIIGLVIQRHGLEITQADFSPENFDSGYQELIAHKRSIGGEVYDAIKQLPAFLRLVTSARSEKLFTELRSTDLAGIAAAGYGIRIDNPFEEQYRSQWHQEFVHQPQSQDGIVLWTPLLPVTQEMGPVMACLGSHQDGLRNYSQAAYADKIGAYQIGLLNAEQITSSYQQTAPLTEPGDVIIMDYLTIHQSGFNVSKRPRWSIQFRLFNFKDPTGMEIGWKASVTVGTNIAAIFPKNVV